MVRDGANLAREYNPDFDFPKISFSGRSMAVVQFGPDECVPNEIPFGALRLLRAGSRPAGENAGLRNDAAKGPS
jgi:hypothetical protein